MSHRSSLPERGLPDAPCRRAALQAGAFSQELDMMEPWELGSRSFSGISEPITTIVMYAGPVEEQPWPPGPHRQWLRRCGWLVCDGSALPVHEPDGSPSVYSQLFAVIGSTYGGDARSFRLPDYRGYVLPGRDGDNTGNDRQGATTSSDDRFFKVASNHVPVHLLIKFTNIVGKPKVSLSHLLGIGSVLNR
jgi:Phage Tail Collar Domain